MQGSSPTSNVNDPELGTFDTTKAVPFATARRRPPAGVVNSLGAPNYGGYGTASMQEPITRRWQSGAAIDLEAEANRVKQWSKLESWNAGACAGSPSLPAAETDVESAQRVVRPDDELFNSSTADGSNNRGTSPKDPWAEVLATGDAEFCEVPAALLDKLRQMGEAQMREIEELRAQVAGTAQAEEEVRRLEAELREIQASCLVAENEIELRTAEAQSLEAEKAKLELEKEASLVKLEQLNQEVSRLESWLNGTSSVAQSSSTHELQRTAAEHGIATQHSSNREQKVATEQGIVPDAMKSPSENREEERVASTAATLQQDFGKREQEDLATTRNIPQSASEQGQGTVATPGAIPESVGKKDQRAAMAPGNVPWSSVKPEQRAVTVAGTVSQSNTEQEQRGTTPGGTSRATDSLKCGAVEGSNEFTRKEWLSFFTHAGLTADESQAVDNLLAWVFKSGRRRVPPDQLSAAIPKIYGLSRAVCQRLEQIVQSAMEESDDDDDDDDLTLDDWRQYFKHDVSKADMPVVDKFLSRMRVPKDGIIPIAFMKIELEKDVSLPQHISQKLKIAVDQADAEDDDD